MQLPGAIAQHLAYYKATYSDGILAPRGWHGCETSGSSGSALFVTPQRYSAEYLIHLSDGAFKGPVIIVSSDDAGTSGRYATAALIARLFPKHRDFITYVLKNYPADPKDYPFGPYKKDKMTYVDKTCVEYITPPYSKGLGSEYLLQSNGLPIAGVVFLDLASDGTPVETSKVNVRLTANSNKLTPAIIKQFERDHREKVRE